MKKLLAVLVLATTGGLLFGQETVALDAAIREIAAYIKERLPANAVVFVSDIESNHAELSDYIIRELSRELTIDKRLREVERKGKTQLMIAEELSYQMSGNVSDAERKRIGRELGAAYVVSGSVKLYRSLYQLTVKANAVETMEVMARPPTMRIRKSDERIAEFIAVDASWKEKRFYFGGRAGGVMNLFDLSQATMFYQEGAVDPNVSVSGAGQFAWQMSGWASVQVEFIFSFSEMNWSYANDTQKISASNIIMPLLFKPTFWPGESLFIAPFIGPYLKMAWGSYQWKQQDEYGTRFGEGNVFFEPFGGLTAGIDFGIKAGQGALFLDLRYLFDGGRSRIGRGTSGDLLYQQNAGNKGTMYRMHSIMISIGYHIGFGDRAR
jgi:TolB-like protein